MYVLSTDSHQIGYIGASWQDACSVKIVRTCGHVITGSGRGKRPKMLFFGPASLISQPILTEFGTQMAPSMTLVQDKFCAPVVT